MPEQTTNDQRRHNTHGDSGAPNHKRLGNCVAQYTGWTGSQSETNAEFMRALLDKIGERAEYSNGHQDQGNGGESSDQEQVETRAVKRLRNAIVHRLQIKNRMIFV
jgi:hypothetical protein